MPSLCRSLKVTAQGDGGPAIARRSIDIANDSQRGYVRPGSGRRGLDFRVASFILCMDLAAEEHLEPALEAQVRFP